MRSQCQFKLDSFVCVNVDNNSTREALNRSRALGGKATRVQINYDVNPSFEITAFGHNLKLSPQSLSSMASTLPPLVQAVSGAIGSASANALVYPLDLVTTRLQLTRSKKIRGG